jgi:hypothetical protein
VEDLIVRPAEANNAAGLTFGKRRQSKSSGILFTPKALRGTARSCVFATPGFRTA